jgi:hypothetical protein
LKCYICDAALANISWNPFHKDFNPCPKCQEVIDNVFPRDEEEAVPLEDEVEPTAEELMADAEEAYYGKFSE